MPFLCSVTRRTVAKIAIVCVLMPGLLGACTDDNSQTVTVNPGAKTSSEQLLTRAYRERLSNLQLEAEGKVTRILPDDNKGSRHQRLIVAVSPAHTVLIAHNIDLAPRINNIAVGDNLRFYGEYEWNNKGGVVHWTHRDPRGKHPSGWLEHRGKRYD